MIQRLLFILFLVAMPEILHGQRIAYSTYPVANEFSVNNQLCCYGVRRTALFRYVGEDAKLDKLRLDAGMFYSGFLQVLFLRMNSVENVSNLTAIESWTGTGFGRATPLTFTSGEHLVDGQIYGVQLIVQPGETPEPQSIGSAAVWRENLDRRSEFGSFSSFVYEVTVAVDEPDVGLLAGIATGLIVFGRRRRSVRRRNS